MGLKPDHVSELLEQLKRREFETIGLSSSNLIDHRIFCVSIQKTVESCIHFVKIT